MRFGRPVPLCLCLFFSEDCYFEAWENWFLPCVFQRRRRVMMSVRRCCSALAGAWTSLLQQGARFEDRNHGRSDQRLSSFPLTSCWHLFTFTFTAFAFPSLTSWGTCLWFHACCHVFDSARPRGTGPCLIVSVRGSTIEACLYPSLKTPLDLELLQAATTQSLAGRSSRPLTAGHRHPWRKHCWRSCFGSRCLYDWWTVGRRPCLFILPICWSSIGAIQQFTDQRYSVGGPGSPCQAARGVYQRRCRRGPTIRTAGSICAPIGFSHLSGTSPGSTHLVRSWQSPASTRAVPHLGWRFLFDHLGNATPPEPLEDQQHLHYWPGLSLLIVVEIGWRYIGQDWRTDEELAGFWIGFGLPCCLLGSSFGLLWLASLLRLSPQTLLCLSNCMFLFEHHVVEIAVHFSEPSWRNSDCLDCCFGARRQTTSISNCWTLA